MNRRIHIAPIVAFMFLLAATVPGAAQDSLEAQKRRELESIQRAAQEKRDAARRLLTRETAEISQLRRTERRLNSTRERLRTLDRRRRTLGQELQVTHVSLVRSEQALRLQKDKLSRRLRNLYKYGGERPFEYLLSTQSFAQLLARWDFLVMVAEQDRMLVEDVLATKATVEQTQTRLEGRIDEIGRNTKKTNRETQQLSSLRSERSKSVKAIQSQRQQYEAAAAELERTALSLKRLLAELERRRREETDRARAQGRSPELYTGDFARGEGRFEWPVRGSLVGHFGTEVHPKWGTVVMNNGIDIATPVGTPVHVVSRGRVDYVSEDFGTYGQMVVVNHGDGYYTLYGHLSTISVSSGAQVATGQLIGYSGDTGSLKGAVLHFEVRKGAQSLNPEKWLR